MYNLLIIDMQEEFSTAQKVIGEVVALIRKAKEDFANITVVEYSNSGKTYGEILRELRDYPLCTTVTKRGDDGGMIVFEHFKESNWLSMDTIVCGVNSDCCVKRTVNSLLESMYKWYNKDYFQLIGKYPNVVVVKKACNNNDYPFFPKDWQWDGYDHRTKFVDVEVSEAIDSVKAGKIF